MKPKYFHSFLAGVAMIMSVTACTPENEVLPAPDLTPADLVEGKAYRVTVDQTTNKVVMTSLLGNGYITSWIHPQGIERKTSTEANIPFAGDYEIKFGVMTRGGMVYGEPYRFSLDTTNGDLLTDPLWTYLTGGTDQSKTWVLDHNNYDLGASTFCCAPMGWDKFTDGKEYTEADYPTYKEDGVDSPNWVWQAGEPDWMLPLDRWAAIPELTFDLVNGANLTVNGVTAPFVMDPDRKTLTMPAGVQWLIDDINLVDRVNVELVKLNEHVLGIKVVRNDGKGGNGDQRIVFCYVEKGWDGKWPVTGPALGAQPVRQPKFDNLTTDLFTVVTSDARYVANSINYLLDSDRPYGFMEWNGTKANSDNTIGAWEWVNNYGSTACPELENSDDFILNFTSYTDKDEDNNDAEYTAYRTDLDGDVRVFKFEENRLIYDGKQPFTLLTAGHNVISGKEFTVLACNPDDGELVIGVPAAKDETGAVNRYLCANMKVKPIAAEPTGPTILEVNNSGLEAYIDNANLSSYRIELYNPWGGDKAWPIDPSKLVLKKNKTIKVTFRINGAVWKEGATPKAVLCHNIGNGLWPNTESVYEGPEAVAVNKNGDTTVSITNTGGSFTFQGLSCLAVCVSQLGLVESPLDDSGNLNPYEATPEIVSVTIE